MSGGPRFVALVLAWQVAASSCYYTVFAATPFFSDAFSLSGIAVGAIITVLTFGYTIFLLPVGSVIDSRGERSILLVGLSGLAICAVAVTVVPTYPLLLGCVVCLGAAYASAMPGTNKAILEGVAVEHRNLALGIKQVGVTAGSAISALLVTGFVGRWQNGFLLVAVAALIVNAVFFLAYRPQHAEAETTATSDTLEPDGGNGADEPTGDRPERTNERTFVTLRRLLARRSYRRLTAAGFFLGATLFTTVGYTVLYVAESIGTSVAFGGIVLAVVQVAGSAGRVGAGWLGDRLHGSERLATARVLLGQAASGTLLLVGVTFVDSRVAALAGFALLGVFVLGFTGIYYSCMGTLVPAARIGSATAGGQMALNAGALVAPPTFGLLIDRAGYDVAWLLLAACGAVATGLLVGIERSTAHEMAE